MSLLTTVLEENRALAAFARFSGWLILIEDAAPIRSAEVTRVDRAGLEKAVRTTFTTCERYQRYA